MVDYVNRTDTVVPTPKLYPGVLGLRIQKCLRPATLGCEQEGEDLTRHVEGSEPNVCAGVVDFESPYLGRGATFAKRCALEDGSGCQLVWVLLVKDISEI